LDEEGALFDSGFDDGGPFRVTPEAGGVSLESALRDYGPAAIDDLIPRLRAIAHELDAAHAAGHVHGALHPSKVIVHDDATSLIRGRVAIAPYAAPEMDDGTATPASDQFGLAAIAYEWMFGRPIDHPADRPVEVRTMPGVDRVTLSKAFTRALAPDPAGRFASCTDFCNAVASAVKPELPFDSEREGAFLAQDKPLLALNRDGDDEDPVGPFIPEALTPTLDEPVIRQDADDVGDLHVPFDSHLTREDAREMLAQDSPPEAVAGWNPSAATPSMLSRESQKFGGFALILSTIVGAIFGFAAGYMARPRALQSAPATITATPGTESPVASATVPEAPAPKAPAPEAPKAVPAAKAAAGRILVRSSPSGATVSVDGTERGVTPLALRDLPMGARNIVVARRGYIAETRRVVITTARPSRSLDVRLSAEAAAATPRPSTPATLGRSAATTGSLNIDSRPAGAEVTVNGKPSGTTPVTINDLSPGEYRILMVMPGYRNFATTVRVVAGERVRAAASLTALEQQ
jgi:hypothetical protein